MKGDTAKEVNNLYHHIRVFFNAAKDIKEDFIPTFQHIIHYNSFKN